MPTIEFSDALQDPRYWMAVADLSLHKRILNPLWNANIRQIIDLVVCSPKGLYEIPGFGRTALCAVRAALYDLGLQLETEVVGGDGHDASAQRAEAIARFEASGDLAQLLIKMRDASNDDASNGPRQRLVGSAMLREEGLTTQQIGKLEGDPALQSELLDLFNRARELTRKIGPLPLDQLFRRQDKIATGLRLLNSARETPEA